MSDQVRDPQVEDLLNFVSTFWTDTQLDIDGEEFISERVLNLRRTARNILSDYDIYPEVHYLNFLVNDRPGKFVIFDADEVVRAEFETAEKCVEAFYEDTVAYAYKVGFLADDEREDYEFVEQP